MKTRGVEPFRIADDDARSVKSKFLYPYSEDGSPNPEYNHLMYNMARAGFPMHPIDHLRSSDLLIGGDYVV